MGSLSRIMIWRVYYIWRVTTYIVLPRSRKSVPGLHSLMASSRQWRAVRMSFFWSSSTRPTGYVSFTSPWKPAQLFNIDSQILRTRPHTVIENRDICEKMKMSNFNVLVSWASHTDIHNLAFLKLTLIGNTMTNNFIYWTAWHSLRCWTRSSKELLTCKRTWDSLDSSKVTGKHFALYMLDAR